MVVTCPIRSFSSCLEVFRGKPLHRAGNIYHKNVLSSGYVLSRYSLRWLSHVKKEVFVFTLVKNEAGSDLISCQTIAQNKVTISLEMDPHRPTSAERQSDSAIAEKSGAMDSSSPG